MSIKIAHNSCRITSAQRVLSGKWTLMIIYFLNEETLRFGELSRQLPNVTQANLTKQLRSLEEQGIVHREVYKEVPPKVEYSLTPIGKKFVRVLDALETWSIEYEKTFIAA